MINPKSKYYQIPNKLSATRADPPSAEKSQIQNLSLGFSRQSFNMRRDPAFAGGNWDLFGSIGSI